jgi:uncharacterized protein YuzB (UPF0349 family)
VKYLKKLKTKEKKIKVDFCEKNLDRFLNDESYSKYNQFLNKKNVVYKEYECQSKCKECKRSPYVIVNGDFITAENSEELLEKLESYVVN